MPRNKNILKELEEIAPDIPWPEKHPDFELPTGYFEGLHEEVMNRIGQMEANELPAQLTGKQPFSVPDGYFEGLPAKVMGKINTENRTYPTIKFHRRRTWTAWASAAAIAAFVALGGLLWLPKNPSSNQGETALSINEQMASLSDHAIEQYLDMNLSAANMDEVYESLNNKGLEDAVTKELSTQAIQEYLQNNAPDSLSF